MYGRLLELSLAAPNVKVDRSCEWNAGADFSPDRPLNPGLPAPESDPTIGKCEKWTHEHDQQRTNRERE
jgi:hypothetical protein